MPKIYEMVNLKEDPFRISPDPIYFYPTTNHDDALQRLYLSIENREGLNVIYGDYGTGKSTMVEIIQKRYGNRDDFIIGKLATAKARSDFQFYLLVIQAFNIKLIGKTTLAARNALEAFALEKNIAEEKTVILIIDEGEALTPTSIDLLRTMLNFESSDRKFFQMVIFGQLELLPKIRKRRNFVDRISMSYVLNPLSMTQMKAMIEFRLKVAGLDADTELIEDDAYETIYKYTKGFPRQTVTLCNEALKSCVLDGTFVITKEIASYHGENQKKLYGDRKIRSI